MAGPSWLVDSRRIATKIKSASEAFDPKKDKWKSNPTKACPNCNHVIDNNDVSQQWPGLPRGVKFDPSDQEIILHLLSKVGTGNLKPHPFIEEFIPTVNEDDGICYAHPQNLPGVKQDGSVSHFFHRAIKAYNTGTRKRRKINGDDLGDVRWHKTGKTKPVFLDGVQRGCKKIMVLYMSNARGGKPEKTNWVMHQYHIGTGEDEKDGDFVVSKVFYQQQTKLGDKVEHDPVDIIEATATKVDPVTPKAAIRYPPRTEEQHSDIDDGQESSLSLMNSVQTFVNRNLEDEVPADCGELSDHNDHQREDRDQQMVDDLDSQWLDSQQLHALCDELLPNQSQNRVGDLLDSQELHALCDEYLRSQSPRRAGDGEEGKMRSLLSDYPRKNLALVDPPHGDEQRNDGDVGAEDQKLVPSDSQNMNQFDLSNIDLGTPPDFRISQLEFGSQSQDSLLGYFGV